MTIEQNYISNYLVLNKQQNFRNFTLRDQEIPSPTQILTSARMKTISTTRSYLESIPQKRTALQSHFNSVANKSELLINAITNIQLNLSRKLLQVFGTVEHASQ
ncbi:Hypothetical_protein [Hexamita inflata]|uniref:Hypothetical_protein n=1 Tax=Hexamita inflata TaxID=28002 RepID=A0AA86PDT6_9EUKA|nr:Hypothetical protein HINF_LOCUS24448 [Hexamita inflata]